MTRDATGRVALVTGGGSGIGEATCLRLAQDGMAVGILDCNLAAAKGVADRIVAEGGRALAVEANVADREAVNAAVAAVHKSLGPVTVAVNNAAVESFTPFADIDDANWDKVLNVNLKGVYIVIQAVLPDMEAAGWGRIVNIAAFGAQLSTPNMGHYYASKGGVISLTRGLAAEVGAKGVTVNTVSPGFIDTPMSRRAIDEGKFPVTPESIYAAYPIPRLGKAEEVAAAVAFLASEEAAYITAQMLGVNGGAVV